MSTATYIIRAGDYEHGGTASRNLKEQLKKIGADPAVIRRAMIAAYEAEMNVVIHSLGGQLRASLHNGQLDVEVIDTGPGIANVEQALREGFSTAPAQARELGFGAGMGLPNIKRNSDQFSIDSAPGHGTHVRFSVRLKPQALYGAGQNSLAIAAERCRQSLRCVRACPTNAIRVFRSKPEILDYLCIDCTACIAVCPTETFELARPYAELRPTPDATLIIPAESLAQFGVGVSPQRVLNELVGLGFAEVRLTTPWEAALRAAVVQYAAHETHLRPVISPACPPIVNLIETRFPSLLPHLAPFRSASAALAADLAGRPALFVASCPAQRTMLVGSFPSVQVVLPAALRAAVMPRLVNSVAEVPARFLGSPHEPPALRVTGLTHVRNLLEEIENGLAGDLEVVEPWACDQGCFGSPLMAVDPFLAQQRWRDWPALGASLECPAPPDQAKPNEPRAVPRAQPFAPRPGLRLDQDMAKAVQKLARIDKLTKSLPGCDCAVCGAPSCAALAEDIVLGRAAPEACLRQETKP